MSLTTAPAGRAFPHVDGVEHRFVEARGVRFHVAEAGVGEPVLLLHTMPQHWYAWRRVIPLLAGEYRVICLDLRGSGWSDAPPTGYDTASRVADVLAVMDTLDIGTTRLVAHGFGAWTGFFVALAAPERISHYLALGMIHPWPRQRDVLPSAWRFWHTALWEYPVLGRLVLRHWPGLTRFLLRHWAADRSSVDEDAVAEFAASSREPARARAGQQLNWRFVLDDILRLATGRNRRHRLTVPTLVLGGERDPVIAPRLLRGGQRNADRLSMRVVPGRGHLLPEEAPGAVAGAARELFRG